MTLTINLTPEAEARLTEMAQKKGVGVAECAAQLLDERLLPFEPETEPLATTIGARILAELEQESALGIWQDRPEDSTELARAWRQEAETRSQDA